MSLRSSLLLFDLEDTSSLLLLNIEDTISLPLFNREDTTFSHKRVLTQFSSVHVNLVPLFANCVRDSRW